MNCRCGHGRGQHYRNRGLKHQPCHAFIQVERPGFTFQGGPVTGLAVVAPRMVTDVCKCRDFVVPGGKPVFKVKARDHVCGQQLVPWESMPVPGQLPLDGPV